MLNELKEQNWEMDEYRQEIMIAAEGLMVMAQLYAKFAEYEMEEDIDIEKWIEKFSKKWLEKNKPSELYRIQEMFKSLNADWEKKNSQQNKKI